MPDKNNDKDVNCDLRDECREQSVSEEFAKEQRREKICEISKKIMQKFYNVFKRLGNE